MRQLGQAFFQPCFTVLLHPDPFSPSAIHLLLFFPHCFKFLGFGMKKRSCCKQDALENCVKSAPYCITVLLGDAILMTRVRFGLFGP